VNSYAHASQRPLPLGDVVSSVRESVELEERCNNCAGHQRPLGPEIYWSDLLRGLLSPKFAILINRKDNSGYVTMH
jgi:hypothetical protein